MTGTIVEKKLLIQQQLQNILNKYHQVSREKDQLFNQSLELQGALKVLQELDYVPPATDQPSDTEPTEGS